MSIYDSLNDQQREAVFCTEGPLLILAGAGSGKTRALTHRICYLIEEKRVSPYHILAITFTNKAAQEMRDRVENLISHGGNEVWVATFHATCARILRRYIDRLGYDTHFTIYDTDDQKQVVRQVIKKLMLDNKQYPERMVLSEISKCKEKCKTPQDYIFEAVDYRERKLGEIYREYEGTLQKNNALDFDDLLLKTVQLFETCPDVLENYQMRFRYIHVDEYQDTNHVQFRLLELLSKQHKNLCVVGDDDQSIYRFRGADISNILDFEQYFPNAHVVKLEQNYRSTPDILDVANCVIRNNTGRKEKRLWTRNTALDMVRYRQFEDSRSEAAAVVEEIKKRVAAGAKYSDCAVLYRTNAQSRLFEESCIRENIPYRIVGGINFYQRAEIKDLLAYLKTIANGRDDVALQRIINVPKRGIGATTLAKVDTFATQCGISMFEAMQRISDVPGIAKPTMDKIRGFVRMILQYRAWADEMAVAELLEELMEEIHYMDELDKLDDEQKMTKTENVDELLNKAADFVNSMEDEEPKKNALDAFLEEVSLVADIDRVDGQEDRVLIMTLHGAKGLEFDHVFMTGMEDGLFPSSMAISSGEKDDMEEERRLCYVGITRAKKTLLLTMAKMRMLRGETQFCTRSRFINEIADHLLKKEGKILERKQYHFDRPDTYTEEYPVRDINEGSRFLDVPASGKNALGSLGYGVTYSKKADKNAGMPAQKKPQSLAYGVGDRVRHQKFGTGVVVAIEDKGRDYTVSIRLDSTGEIKKMMSMFANLEKI